MLGDRDALKQILLILLDNALKHSQGTIRVTARRGEHPLDESLALNVEVFPFALPDENHLGISLNDYGSLSPRRMPKEKLWAV